MSNLNDYCARLIIFRKYLRNLRNLRHKGWGQIDGWIFGDLNS